jgi:hypothetical protein
LNFNIKGCYHRVNSRIDTTVILGGVGHLGPFTPDNLTGSGNKTQLGNVDFDNGSLRQDTQLGIERVLGVLLDGQDGQLDGDSKLGTGEKKLVSNHSQGNRA